MRRPPPMLGFEWQSLGEMFLKVAGAFLFALPVAWDREKQTRIMGLRTFPIVAMASCGYLLIAQELFTDDQAQARVAQGLITGMGFIGGGAILKQGDRVRGTATASSLWATGAVGMAVAYARLDIAAAISLVVFLTLRLISPIAEEPPKSEEGEPTSGDE